MAGGPGKELELISHHQPEEFRKGQKGMPPPRILTDIHLGWKRCAPPGRTLSQNDWPKTTQKRIPLPQNPRLRATWQSSSLGFPYPAALCPRCLFPIKSLALPAHVSSDNYFPTRTLDKSLLLGPWKGPPFLQRQNNRRSRAWKQDWTLIKELAKVILSTFRIINDEWLLCTSLISSF